MKPGNTSKINLLILVTIVMAAMVATQSCSVKKNTAATRRYHAFVTRYNVLYNGESHYDEAVRQMTESFEDDYTRPIPPHPADAYLNSATRPSGNFSYSIEKAQKAIGLHSITRRPRGKAGHRRDPVYRAWMSRKEYNPVIDRAWLLLGNSYYMSGRYDDAAIVFGAAETRFSHNKEMVALCRIMQARCRADMGRTLEASMLLDRVREKNLTNRHLRYLYFLTAAIIDGNRANYSAASSMAVKAALNAPDSDAASRLRYLAAQLSELGGDNTTAATLFGDVAHGRGFNQSRKLNSIMEEARLTPGLSLNDRLKPLKRLASRSSNKRYLDRIFNTMGDIQLAHGDTAGATASFQKVISLDGADPFYQGKASLSAALLKLKISDYGGARGPLANAVMLLPDNYDGLDTLRQMSDILDRLGDLENSIRTTDSLLYVASLPERERDRIIADRIKSLRHNQSSEPRETQSAGAVTMLTGEPTEIMPSMPGDNSWYFYNRTAVEAGRSDFKRRWGARKLEDDWRRSVKTTVGRPDDELFTANADEPEKPDETTPDDPLTPGYHLARLPLSPQSQAAAIRLIEQNMLDYGMTVVNELHDPEKAEQVFDSLFTRFPDNPSRPDIYMAMLRAFARKGSIAQAHRYRLKMADEFSDTPEGKAMANQQYIRNLMTSVSSQEDTYRHVYQAYLDGMTSIVHQLADSTLDIQPDGHLAPKFLFLDAMAYAAEKDRDGFNRRLSRLVSAFPDADVSPLAADYLDGLREGRELTGGIVKTVQPEITETDCEPTSDDYTIAKPQTLEFDFATDVPHAVAVTLDSTAVNINKLIFEIARFNFATFDTRDFDILPINMPEGKSLAIARFDDYDDALDYISKFSRVNRQLMSVVRLTPLPVVDLDRLIVNSMTIDSYINARSHMIANPLQYEH